MAKQNNAESGEIFARPERQSAGFGAFALFVLVMALMFGGFYLMSISFGANESVLTFVLGMVISIVSFVLAFATGYQRKKIGEK